MELDVGHHRPAVVVRGRLVPQHLLERVGDEGQIPHEVAALVGWSPSRLPAQPSAIDVVSLPALVISVR
mgnify:CR=1 FL=1